MKRFKKALNVISYSLVAIIALCSILLTVSLGPALSVAIPPQHEKEFENAITEKMDRLKDLDRSGKNKAVIIGGSSTAFGFDSELLEEYLGMPVVNLGTYAALGTKLMLDLADGYIKKGDIVIISPEIEAQTLSMYFSSAATLRAIDGEYSLLFDIPAKHWLNLYGASWSHSITKWNHFKNGTAPNSSGVYNADNFNVYGDIEYDRKENKMTYYYDKKNNAIRLDESILSADFAEYLNDYYKKLTRRGAQAYFYYCPMNILSAEATGTYENRFDFQKYLDAQLDIPIIGDIDSHLMEPGYFYDTNFHLNGAGARMNTILLLEELFLYRGDVRGIEEEKPAAPALPEHSYIYDGVDPNAEYFTFMQKADGYYMITGVKDEYRHLTELTIPVAYNGCKVNTIGKGAFEGSSVDKLIITVDTNLTDIMNGAFSGASNLSGLYIYCKEADKLPPPENFNGTQDDFTIYFEPGSSFQDGYYWKPLYDGGLKWAFILE